MGSTRPRRCCTWKCKGAGRHDARDGRMTSFGHQRDLIRHLVRRDFTLRYHDSALGVLWSLLLPLAQLLVLVFLFQWVVPLGIEAYPGFVFSALLPWAWFSASVGDAGFLFIGNRDLVRQPYFRPATLMLVNTLSRLVSYLVSLPILFAVLLFYDRVPTSALLALPVLLLIEAILILGLGLIIATLNVYYRDVQHIVTVLLSLLFYMTPVFYRPQQVTEKFQLMYAYNPLVCLIDGYRAVFFYGRLPEPRALLVATLASLALWLVGDRIYRRQQHDLVDAI
jgi:lipopolysaccharide transport system permease protein